MRASIVGRWGAPVIRPVGGAAVALLLVAAVVEPVMAFVPSSVYEPESAAPGTTVLLSVTPPCGGTTLYLWPGRADLGVSYPTGPRDPHLVNVPLRTTDREGWLAFVVPRVPPGLYTSFFDVPPGCSFRSAGSADTQRYFDVLPAQPDTAAVEGSFRQVMERRTALVPLAFLLIVVAIAIAGALRLFRRRPYGR